MTENAAVTVERDDVVDLDIDLGGLAAQFPTTWPHLTDTAVTWAQSRFEAQSEPGKLIEIAKQGSFSATLGYITPAILMSRATVEGENDAMFLRCADATLSLSGVYFQSYAEMRHAAHAAGFELPKLRVAIQRRR